MVTVLVVEVDIMAVVAVEALVLLKEVVEVAHHGIVHYLLSYLVQMVLLVLRARHREQEILILQMELVLHKSLQIQLLEMDLLQFLIERHLHKLRICCLRCQLIC